MHFAYILKSQTTGKYYIGSTNDLEKRLRKHNIGGNKSTKPGRLWVLVHNEPFLTKQEAYGREMQLKSYKGGRVFKNLLGLS